MLRVQFGLRRYGGDDSAATDNMDAQIVEIDMTEMGIPRTDGELPWTSGALAISMQMLLFLIIDKKDQR